MFSSSVFLAFLLFFVSGTSYAEGPGYAYSKFGGEEVAHQSLGFVKGNKSLVSIQPYLVNEDFTTTATFEAKMKRYFEAAKSLGYFTDETVVVLPELIGLYLYFANETASVYKQNDLLAAGTKIVISTLTNPRKTIGFMSQPPLMLPGQPLNFGGLLNRKLLNFKAVSVAKDYQQVFSRLAAKYRVTIAAGSVPLPGPYVSPKGVIEVNKKLPMRNVGFLFHKNGDVDTRIVIKVHPIKSESESLFIVGGAAENLPVYDLPIGRLSFVICADTWYPDIYESLKKKNVDIIVAGSLLGPKNIGEAPWQGYNSPLGKSATPADVDLTDIGWISEWQAWQKYAFLGRADKSGARFLLSSFMNGKLWGEDFYGSPFVGLPGSKEALPQEPNRATLYAIYL